MSDVNYRKAEYLLSAGTIEQLPPDNTIEVAFAGRSNAGKSSALNVLTQNSHLAKVSKTPGRTQCINFFKLDEQRRLVDLPGYGYAKVSGMTKERWQHLLEHYLQDRQSLRGLVLLMDIRHPLKETDTQLLHWASASNLPIHILLTKADKLSRNGQMNAKKPVEKYIAEQHLLNVSMQVFSSLTKEGFETLRDTLNKLLTESSPT